MVISRHYPVYAKYLIVDADNLVSGDCRFVTSRRCLVYSSGNYLPPQQAKGNATYKIARGLYIVDTMLGSTTIPLGACARSMGIARY